MRIRVKVCGIREIRHVEAAADAGADALGFVFAESPRRLPASDAAGLLEAVPPFVARVAVFRRPSPEQVRDVLAAASFDWVQADSGSRDAVASATRASFVPVFHDGVELASLVRAWDGSARRGAGVVLVDGADSGSGRTADWERVARVARGTRVVLSGGLTPGNVGEALRRVRPWGVDVSSGVESERGRKDPSLIAAFLEAVRSAERDMFTEESR